MRNPSGAAFAMLFAAIFATAAMAAEPVKVMIVGTMHFSNPGADMHNVKVDDVLVPKRQAEIARVAAGLARFKPTVVATEWPADIVAQRYPKYVDGTLAESRNEVVQLGFRLGKTAGLTRVYGTDADGDFPYDAVDVYAKAHGQTAVLEAANAEIEAMVKKQADILATQSVSSALRYLNDPARLRGDNGFYRATLRVGGGDDQPGVALLAAWQTRNLKICAKLIQLAEPGDRMVVFFGSGHAFLLRQCVQETPGLELVEANDYLPR